MTEVAAAPAVSTHEDGGFWKKVGAVAVSRAVTEKGKAQFAFAGLATASSLISGMLNTEVCGDRANLFGKESFCRLYVHPVLRATRRLKDLKLADDAIELVETKLFALNKQYGDGRSLDDVWGDIQREIAAAALEQVTERQKQKAAKKKQKKLVADKLKGLVPLRHAAASDAANAAAPLPHAPSQ